LYLKYPTAAVGLIPSYLKKQKRVKAAFAIVATMCAKRRVLDKAYTTRPAKSSGSARAELSFFLKYPTA